MIFPPGIDPLFACHCKKCWSDFIHCIFEILLRLFLFGCSVLLPLLLDFVFPFGDDFAFGSCVSWDLVDLRFGVTGCHDDVIAWAGWAWLLAIQFYGSRVSPWLYLASSNSLAHLLGHISTAHSWCKRL